jgi:hypothetical protein
MGYLPQSVITVDAILTRKGRELLASGVNNFNITKFALGDADVDYSLWDPENSLGSLHYSDVIMNLPILEAIPDETIAMQYFLVSLPTQTTNAPYISVAPTSFTLSYNQNVILTPSTTPAQTQQYRAVLNNPIDFSIVAIAGSTGGTTSGGTPGAMSPSGGNSSSTAIGTQFKVTSLNSSPGSKTCIITISGINVGGSVNASGTALGYSLPNPGIAPAPGGIGIS